MYMAVVQVSTRSVTSLKISEHLKHTKKQASVMLYIHITAHSINKSITEHTTHICTYHTASSKTHYTAHILENFTYFTVF
jgi:hypothetical protein